jgi:putative peptidoglycan lipid II flippase
VGAFAPIEATTVLLAGGYSLAYLIGATVSATVLGRRIGRLGGHGLVAHLGRLLVPAVVAGACSYGLLRVLGGPLSGLPEKLADLITLAVGGMAGLIVFVGLAYLLRIGEVRDAINLLARRVRPHRSEIRPSMDLRNRAEGDRELDDDRRPRRS